MERFILYFDIFLLTLAIGLNVEMVNNWYNSPPYCEECFCQNNQFHESPTHDQKYAAPARDRDL